MVHLERQALVEDLQMREVVDWDTPSLCPGWSVHDVLAHLVDDAKTTTFGFVRRFAGAGFDFDRSNGQGVARERRTDPWATLEAFAAVSSRTTAAPASLATRLVEALVHGEDIRRPLGIGHSYPPAAAVSAMRYQLGTSIKMGGGKERAEGLRLIATDVDFAVGSGPEARGTVLDLLVAVCGRKLMNDRIQGPGAVQLQV